MIFVEADELDTNLWQGSFPEPGREVAMSGFKLLVLCAEELQIHPEEYPGVRVILAPNKDDGHSKLTRKRLAIAVEAAREVTVALQAGEKTLVTCAEGINRSSLVSALALHFLHGWSGTQCIDHIRIKRHRRKGFTPLNNSDFVKALEKLNLKGKLPEGWRESPGGLWVPSEE